MVHPLRAGWSLEKKNKQNSKVKSGNIVLYKYTLKIKMEGNNTKLIYLS